LRPRPDDIDQLANFLIALQKLHDATGAQNLRHASAATFSATEAIAQCEQRLHRLVEHAQADSELREFIDRDLAPSTRLARRRVEERYDRLKLDPAALLAPAHRALSPSDFGLHNAMRSQDGQLRFIDFEYFGWDDPVKLTADMLHHPGTPLGGPQAARLRAAALRIYGDDPAFAPRLAALFPLFGLRWVLILLNEFLPERWQRRVAAGEAAAWGDAKARQLARARDLLATLAPRPEAAHG